MPHRLNAPAIALALFAEALAACNGESPSESRDGSGPLSKREFIERADEICRETESAIAALDPPQSPEEVDEYIDELEQSSREGIADLRSLEPPPRDVERVRQFIGFIERSVDLLPEYSHANERGDAARVQEIESELQAIQGDAVGIARDYGFKSCGGDEVAPSS